MKREDVTGIFLFHALHRAHANAVQAELNARGLQGVGSPMILFMLQSQAKEGVIANQRELASRMRISPATVATSLKSLERLGYVERRVDENDGRCNRIAITAKGADAVRQCRLVFQKVDEAAMAGFTEEESAVLDGYHRRMLDNLRSIGGARTEGRNCV